MDDESTPCGTCGVLVSDPAKHMDWHDAHDRQPSPVLYTTWTSASTSDLATMCNGTVVTGGHLTHSGRCPVHG